MNLRVARLSRVSKQINGLYGLVDFEDRKVTIKPSKQQEFDYFIRKTTNYNPNLLNDKIVTNLKIMPSLF